jgi:hypothetical protein
MFMPYCAVVPALDTRRQACSPALAYFNRLVERRDMDLGFCQLVLYLTRSPGLNPRATECDNETFSLAARYHEIHQAA